MRIWILALLLAGTTAEAAIYKCEVNGKTVMTDRPCAANAVPETVRDPNHMDAPTPAAKRLAKEHDQRTAREAKELAKEDAAWVQAHDADSDKADRVRKGLVERKAVRGMTSGELRQALGEPDSISRTDTARGATERWEYTLASGGTQAVTLSNGEVTAVLTKGKSKKKKKK